MAWAWTPSSRVEGSAYERACEGKTAYPSESSAEAGLRFLQRQGMLRTNDGMTVYQCTFCREWHFGH